MALGASWSVAVTYEVGWKRGRLSLTPSGWRCRSTAPPPSALLHSEWFKPRHIAAHAVEFLANMKGMSGLRPDLVLGSDGGAEYHELAHENQEHV